MGGRGSILVMTLVLTVSLLLPGEGTAGPLVDHLLGRQTDCPPTSYSPCHYWTPTLYRLQCYCHNTSPCLWQFPPGPSPEVPPSYRITKYPCPAVNPRDFPYEMGSTGSTGSPKR
jgi:hypothetical protein